MLHYVYQLFIIEFANLVGAYPQIFSDLTLSTFALSGQSHAQTNLEKWLKSFSLLLAKTHIVM